MPRKKERTFVFVKQHGIMRPWPDEWYQRIYDTDLPLKKGDVVEVEGSFWTQRDGHLITSNFEGLYKVKEVYRSKDDGLSNRFDETHSWLERITENGVKKKPVLTLYEHEALY